MYPVDNTEGTQQPWDTVETAREGSAEKKVQLTQGSDCPYCGVLAVSSTEALLNKAFRKLSISFSTQQQMFGWRSYQVDILITQRPVVVEADELYHQIQRDQQEHDARKDRELRAAGYEVFRFTEEEIGSNADGCAWYVAEQAHLVPEEDPVFVIRKLMSGVDSPTWKGGKPGWDCATCGKHFHAYLRSGKPRMNCSRECQSIWQAETGASVQGRRSNGVRMRELWNDPAWRAKQTEKIRLTRWPGRS